MTSKEVLQAIRDDVVYDKNKLCDVIEKDLEVLEIIRNHKLLNYVLKNKKCADMYKLTDSELNKVKEWIQTWQQLNN